MGGHATHKLGILVIARFYPLSIRVGLLNPDDRQLGYDGRKRYPGNLELFLDTHRGD